MDAALLGAVRSNGAFKKERRSASALNSSVEREIRPREPQLKKKELLKCEFTSGEGDPLHFFRKMNLTASPWNGPKDGTQLAPVHFKRPNNCGAVPETPWRIPIYCDDRNNPFKMDGRPPSAPLQIPYHDHPRSLLLGFPIENDLMPDGHHPVRVWHVEPTAEPARGKAVSSALHHTRR